MDLSSFSHSYIYAGNTCTQKLAEGEVEVPVEEWGRNQLYNEVGHDRGRGRFQSGYGQRGNNISQVKEKGGKK